MVFLFTQTVEFARSYYSCDSIEGVSFENELATRYINILYAHGYIYVHEFSSHWERRTLNHEIMNGFIAE